MRRLIIGVIMAFLCALVLLYSVPNTKDQTYPMRDYYIAHAYSETGASNAITSIYLFYRYYDTLFEALMLLFSIIGVIYMSIHEEDSEDDF